jgi:hypothetical protein
VKVCVCVCVCAGGRARYKRAGSSSALSAAAITFDGAAAGRNNEVIISGLLALGLLFGQFPPRRNHRSKYPSREEITRPTDKWAPRHAPHCSKESGRKVRQIINARPTSADFLGARKPPSPNTSFAYLVISACLGKMSAQNKTYIFE